MENCTSTTCLEGTFVNSSKCSLCELGKYSDKKVAKTCTNCSVGMYASFKGASVCLNPSPAKFSDSKGASSERFAKQESIRLSKATQYAKIVP